MAHPHQSRHGRHAGLAAAGASRDRCDEVAAIGDGTAAAFRRWARRDPDLVPPTFTTTGLARAFPRGTGRVLCARADIAPSGLEGASPRRGGPRPGSTPTGPGSPAPCPPRPATPCGTVRSTRSRSRAPRPCAGSSGRSAPCEGAQGRLHRARHGRGGARPRAHGACRRPTAHDGRPGRGRGTGAAPLDDPRRRSLDRGARWRRERRRRYPDSMSFPEHRPRRLRRTPALRALVRETRLHADDLIMPMFCKEGIDEPVPIASMPGQFQHALESLRKEAVAIGGDRRARVHALRCARHEGRRGIGGMAPRRHRATRDRRAASRSSKTTWS